MRCERNVDKKTWWWKKEVQEGIEAKTLVKKWDTEKTEESRQVEGEVRWRYRQHGPIKYQQ